MAEIGVRTEESDRDANTDRPVYDNENQGENEMPSHNQSDFEFAQKEKIGVCTQRRCLIFTSCILALIVIKIIVLISISGGKSPGTFFIMKYEESKEKPVECAMYQDFNEAINDCEDRRCFAYYYANELGGCTECPPRQYQDPKN